MRERDRESDGDYRGSKKVKKHSDDRSSGEHSSESSEQLDSRDEHHKEEEQLDSLLKAREKPYKRHESLELRVDRYKNWSKLAALVKASGAIFGIFWSIPVIHYLFHKDIPEKVQLKGEEGMRLKLHFMHIQNEDDAYKRAKPLAFDLSKTKYLNPFFKTEYPYLDRPDLPCEVYITRSFMKHLESQNVLDQAHALELMASCHDRYQMATFFIDMRREALSFARRGNRWWRVHPDMPDKFQMYLGDLWSLAQDLLGDEFSPRLKVKWHHKSKNTYLSKISLFVNEYGEPARNMEDYNGDQFQEVTF